MEILRLAASGLTDREIAISLGISPHTVSTHWKRLRSHFDATSRTEVVAKVIAEEADSRKQLDLDEQNRLLYEIAERERTEAKLREVVSQLREVIQSRNELLSKTLVSYEAQQKTTLDRLAHLETLNRVVCEFGCIPNEGMHGTSWQKTWVSEAMEQFGYTAEEVLAGTVNVFNTIHPEDLPDSLEQCTNASPNRSRVLLSHRFITKSGEQRHLLDFLHLNRVDSSGIGRAAGFAIDITDWIPMFKERIARGWPDLPLKEPASPFP